MARRRGFFAELQHQAAVAERDRQRAQAAQVREQVRQHKEWQRALAASQRAREQAARADERARVAAERESKRLYAEARSAEADAMTAAAELRLQEIDDVLLATLSVDDYVDLEALRQRPVHPPFSSPHLDPLPPVPAIDPGPQPSYSPARLPLKPTRGGRGGHGQHPGRRNDQVSRDEMDWLSGLYTWWARVDRLTRERDSAVTERARGEQERHRRLALDRSVYDQQCRGRERETAERNQALDRLIAGFARSEPDSVEEYFGIVLSNSAYPEGLQPDYDFTVDVTAHEMTIQVLLATPDALPGDKGHRYVKARDEITAISPTQKEARDRYAGLLHNVAMRTLHELWEADRTRKLATISMTVGVTAVDRATGHDAVTPLLAVAVDRSQFEALSLAQVDAAASLAHLGAVVSKQPWALSPIGTSTGVRTR